MVTVIFGLVAMLVAQALILIAYELSVVDSERRVELGGMFLVVQLLWVSYFVAFIIGVMS